MKMKANTAIIGIAIAGIGAYLAYRYFTQKKTVTAQTTQTKPTYARGISGIAELESVYGLNTPIYYNPTTKTAQINPPARTIFGGAGVLYAT
jgi:hypothetical protein